VVPGRCTEQGGTDMTKAVKVGKHYFKYDREMAIVRMYYKPKDEELQEMIADNKEWQKKYGKNLWDIDEDGLMYIDGAGLRRENWDNKDARNEYLAEMEADFEEEANYLMQIAL
jgi:nuclear transport factor 2 (NTF2) superfamily protein